MKRLEGKIAIITGASAGIGKASALLFASEGASLGLIDINLDGGKEVCEEIRKNGGKAEFYGIDVSNPEAMKGAFEAVADTYGGIDVLYNNAGGATPRDDYILKMPLDEFDHAIGLNLFGAPAGLPSCDSLYESTWRRLDHQHRIHPFHDRYSWG